MGVFTIKCYGIQCDGCDMIHAGNSTRYNIALDDEFSAIHAAVYDDWKQINGKWYCPECVAKLFYYYEELDKYVPKNKEDKK